MEEQQYWDIIRQNMNTSKWSEVVSAINKLISYKEREFVEILDIIENGCRVRGETEALEVIRLQKKKLYSPSQESTERK